MSIPVHFTLPFVRSNQLSDETFNFNKRNITHLTQFCIFIILYTIYNWWQLVKVTIYELIV